MKRYLLNIVLIFVLLSSCDEYLDMTPKGVLIPDSPEDFQLLMAGPVFFNSTKINLALDDDYYHPNPGSLDPEWQNTYKWEPYIYNITENDKDWGDCYERVFTANIAIQELNNLEGSPEQKMVLAEAYFHRSYSFFTLVNLYAKHYNSETAENDLGIPLILKPNLENEDYTRSSVKDVYDRILSDVEMYIDYLPNNQENKALPGKSAAYAFLARVHLYMNNFDEAREYAGMALDLHDEIFDLRENPNGYSYKTNDYTESYINKVAVPFISFRINEEVRQIFEDNDLRFSIFFNEETDLGQPTYLYNFFLKFGTLSVPEMYLIRAEVNARENNVQDALNDLNTIREYRFLSEHYEPIEVDDVTDIFETVMLERRRELIFKGHRWFDLKRLNSEGKWSYTLERKDENGNVIYSLPPNDNKWVLAIPPKVIYEYNNDLIQNPR